MLKVPTLGELAFNDTHTLVMVSLDKDELAAVKVWAEACGKSIPGLIKRLVLEGIQYECENNISDT